MAAPTETVPRPTTLGVGRGTAGEKAGQGAGRIAGRAHPPTLKELAAQVLARVATRDSVRDTDRDATRNDCPTAHDLGREAGQSPASAADAFWRDYFEERAAIREHDGGLSRADAEAGALADCVARWRFVNPLPASGGGACVHCGLAGPDTPVLARGGHAWLHRGCWAPMNALRNETARATILAALEAV
jgi:hypothetical protein